MGDNSHSNETAQRGPRIQAINPPNYFTGQVASLAYADASVSCNDDDPKVLLTAPSNTGIYITRIDVVVVEFTTPSVGEPLEQLLQILAQVNDLTPKQTFMVHMVRAALDGIGVYDQPLPFITPPQSGIFVPANQTIVAQTPNQSDIAGSVTRLFVRFFFYI